jgi:hypothetical protein
VCHPPGAIRRFILGSGIARRDNGGMPYLSLHPLECRVLLAGDFVAASHFAPLAETNPWFQAESAVAVDAAGDAVMAGSFAGTTIDLDPSSGGATFLTGSAGGDVYVAKYSQAGALVWARQVRSTGTGAEQYVKAIDVATDAAGNVYVAGNFRGPVDFDPGAGTHVLTTAASTLTAPAFRQEQFALKLDAAGNFVWARQVGAASGDAYTGGLAVDGARNVVVSGSAAAGEGGGEGIGVRVTRLDPAGAVAWSRNSEVVGTRLTVTVAPRSLPKVAVDSAGDVIVGGTFHGRPVFGRGEGNETRLSAAGTDDIFAWKLSAGGSTLWARSEGGSNYDTAYDVAVDAADNIYLAGLLGAPADMDPRKGVESILPAEFETAYVSKLSPAGDLVWARQAGRRAGRVGTSYADKVAVAADGSIYLAGKIAGQVDLDPDPAASFVITGKNADGTTGTNFVTRLDSAGAFVYARSFAGRAHVFDDDNNNLSLAISPANGHLFVTDTFAGVQDFNPLSTAVSNMTAQRQDVFLLELTG